MQHPFFAFMPAFAATVVAAALVVAFDLAVRLGAHPFWSAQVVWIGLAPAIALVLLALRAPRASAIAAVVLAVAGAASARLGKQIFAASYAENALAGEAWYLGWIALSAGVMALIGIGFLLWPRGLPRR